MALFFFDVDDGSVHTGDKFGVELPDIEAATVEAAALAGELLRDRPREFWATQEWKLTVEDSGGLILFTIVVAATVAAAAQGVIAQPKRA